MNTLEEIKTKLEELSQQADKDGKRFMSRMLYVAASKVEQAVRHDEREARHDRQKGEAKTAT